MARKQRRPAATTHRHLAPLHDRCWECGRALWFAYQNTRTVTMLEGLVHLTLQIRRCPNRAVLCTTERTARRRKAQWPCPRASSGWM